MSPLTIDRQLAHCASWPTHFSQEEWKIYGALIRKATERGIPFAIGGGLAAMTYACYWRNTKDLDVYIRKRDCDKMIAIATELGLEDYYDEQPYDRKWIHRLHRGDIIVDLIWAMANQRAVVEDGWLNGPIVEAGGERFRLLCPEEELWTKLYVLQHDRCDWPDALNLIYGVGREIDWRRLLHELGSDAPLLAGLLLVFSWLCPNQARELPLWLWDHLGIRRPIQVADQERARENARLLDSRSWFAPVLEMSDSGETGVDEKEKQSCSSVG